MSEQEESASLFVFAVIGRTPENDVEFCADFEVGTIVEDVITAATNEFKRRYPDHDRGIGTKSYEIKDGMMLHGIDGNVYRIRIEQIAQAHTH